MSLFTGTAAAEPKACSEAPFDTLFEKTVSAESTRRQEARDENDPHCSFSWRCRSHVPDVRARTFFRCPRFSNGTLVLLPQTSRHTSCAQTFALPRSTFWTKACRRTLLRFAAVADALRHNLRSTSTLCRELRVTLVNWLMPGRAASTGQAPSRSTSPPAVLATRRFVATTLTFRPLQPPVTLLSWRARNCGGWLSSPTTFFPALLSRADWSEKLL